MTFCKKCGDTGMKLHMSCVPTPACECHKELLEMRERAVAIRRNRVEVGSLGEALLAQVIEILGKEATE